MIMLIAIADYFKLFLVLFFKEKIFHVTKQLLSV
jgi:hypothetical protein